MNILLIEDNNIKADIVTTRIREFSPSSLLSRAASYQSGVEALVKTKFDVVILDMTLPVSDLDQSPVGMDFLTFGGEMVLRECKRRKIVAKIILLTQYDSFVCDDREVAFDELRARLLKEYSTLVLECVHMNRSEETWWNNIKTIIAE